MKQQTALLKNTEKPVGDTDEKEERNEQGLPDVSAENLDDAGDIEGLQLGLATDKTRKQPG